MSDRVVKLIEDVKTLTILELLGPVKALEEEFGVSAVVPVAIVVAPTAITAPAVEKETESDVALKAAGANKIQVIKVVRGITDLGPKEAREPVDGAPRNVKEGASKDDAEAIKAGLTEAGAEAEMK